MSRSARLLERIQRLLSLDENGMVRPRRPMGGGSARRTISFSGGTRHVKLKCAPGYKLVNNICQRQSQTEILSRRRAARQAVRKRKSKAGQANRKRMLTMRRRHSAGF